MNSITITAKNKKQSGFTLIEAMLAVFIVTLTGIMFAAIFPTSQINHKKSAYMSYATSMAQKQMEEIKAAGYANAYPTDWVKTPVDELPDGIKSIAITQYAPNTRKVEVKIEWDGYRHVGGKIELVTLISDRS